MKRKSVLLVLGVGLWSGALFSGGCTEGSRTTIIYGPCAHHGPPPHAPAWGYRCRQEKALRMEFDPELGVYIVLGTPNVYFFNGFFFKLKDKIWLRARDLNGPWVEIEVEDLPPGLRKIKCKGCKKHKKHKCKHERDYKYKYED